MRRRTHVGGAEWRDERACSCYYFIRLTHYTVCQCVSIGYSYRKHVYM